MKKSRVKQRRGAVAALVAVLMIVLLAMVIVGGRARNLGTLVGCAVVGGLIIQGSTFLPQIGPVGLLPSLQVIAIGLLLLGFLWFRPEGILPEQKEKFGSRPTMTGPQSDELAGPTHPANVVPIITRLGP